MTCLRLFQHFIVGLIEWNIHLLWVWAMLGSAMLMKTLEDWDICIFITWRVSVCAAPPPHHLYGDQLEFNGRNHQKDKVNIQLVQSYRQIEGCPPENEPSTRRIYVFWSCVHITPMFWCASIINNVSNSFLGDTGCLCSPEDAALVDLRKCCFSAAFCQRPVHPWFKQFGFSFYLHYFIPPPLPGGGRSCSPCGKVSSPPPCFPSHPIPPGRDALAQRCNAAGNVYPPHPFVWAFIDFCECAVYTRSGFNLFFLISAGQRTDVSLTAAVSGWRSTRIHSLHQ